MRSTPASSAARADINVTPLIDILLVLLIIFMVITPLSSRGLPAEIPIRSADSPAPKQQPMVLEIASNSILHLNGQELQFDALDSEIHKSFSNNPATTLFIKAAKNLDYREVAVTIDRVRGINPSIQIGLLTAQAD